MRADISDAATWHTFEAEGTHIQMLLFTMKADWRVCAAVLRAAVCRRFTISIGLTEPKVLNNLLCWSEWLLNWLCATSYDCLRWLLFFFLLFLFYLIFGSSFLLFILFQLFLFFYFCDNILLFLLLWFLIFLFYWTDDIWLFIFYFILDNSFFLFFFFGLFLFLLLFSRHFFLRNRCF